MRTAGKLERSYATQRRIARLAAVVTAQIDRLTQAALPGTLTEG